MTGVLRDLCDDGEEVKGNLSGTARRGASGFALSLFLAEDFGKFVGAVRAD